MRRAEFPVRLTWSAFFLIAAGCMVTGLAVSPALAVLKDQQVARLVLLKSRCILAKLVRTEHADGSWTYRGSCSNEVFYPDGIDIACPDPESNDERTCTILTEAKRFDSLDLMAPRTMEPPPR